jgi:hypothetical protein
MTKFYYGCGAAIEFSQIQPEVALTESEPPADSEVTEDKPSTQLRRLRDATARAALMGINFDPSREPRVTIGPRRLPEPVQSKSD